MNIQNYLRPDLLKGQTAFITGGGSGINLGIGKAYASLGANVAICGRTAAKLESAAKELAVFGTEVFFQSADVRDYEAVQDAMHATEMAIGPISTLVCGAAGNFVSKAENLSANGFRTVVEIDLLGAFHASRAAFDQLKRTKGSILFISGGQAFVPFAYQAHVGAAKAGIDNLMASLALEWGKYGIRSNSIVPGPIGGTEGLKRLGGDAAERVWLDSTPLGRLGKVEDVGALAAFLASPLASYITGSHIKVDGGQNLTGSISFNAAVGRALEQAEKAV